MPDDHGFVENLEYRDDLKDEQREHRGLDGRDGDAPKTLPCPRSIDARGLVHRVVDLLKTRKIDEGGAARSAPRHREDDEGDDQIHVARPALSRQTEKA